MVLLFVLTPLIVALAMAYYRPMEDVLLYVYLPCLMLVPRVLAQMRGGIDLDPWCFLAVLLAVCGVVRQFQTLRITLLDVCVFLNAVSVYLAYWPNRTTKLSTITLVQHLFAFVLPYVIGRTLIEQTGIRIRFAKVLVICLCIVAVVSIWEFRMTTDLFLMAVGLIDKSAIPPYLPMMRWGFARIAGPYIHSIAAGMIFSIGFLLQVWLVSSRRWRFIAVAQPLASARTVKITSIGVFLGLFMTQSRGPWLGCSFGVIIAAIGLAKNRKRAAIIALSSIAIYLSVTAVILNKYTDSTQQTAQDADQSDAVYRRELIDTYQPMIERGGLWGWGAPHLLPNGWYGYDPRQPSIDNEYLRVVIAQGYVGITLFILIIGVATGSLIRQCRSLVSREDITFAYCMLGIVAGSAFSLTTVYLGQPTSELLFLILGWTQSIQPTPRELLISSTAEAQPYVFEQIFV
jgi:hypothetical protein